MLVGVDRSKLSWRACLLQSGYRPDPSPAAWQAMDSQLANTMGHNPIDSLLRSWIQNSSTPLMREGCCTRSARV
jgi:hypothetical protein